MKTAFAPAERKTGPDLARDISFICQNPLVDGLMESVGGLMAVLNEDRQVLALNTHLLKWMGVDNPEDLLGLRPGEILQCRHAQNESGGCGTTEFCRTCGAAIAIVTGLASNQPIERTCALSVNREQGSRDLFLRVQATPLTVNSQKFQLLFLQDISNEHRLAALERVFFHDIRNLLGGLTGVCDVIDLSEDVDEIKPLANRANRLSRRIAREIDIQDALSHALQKRNRSSDAATQIARLEKITIQKVFAELKDQFSFHPLNQEKRVQIGSAECQATVFSDFALLLRILGNMITNALESGSGQDPIKLDCVSDPEFVTFRVWNPQPIPHDVSLRIFQRHFSTKKEFGRGLGTYSMKLFGEDVLGGKVDFTSAPEQGTTFRLRLPLASCVKQP